MTMTLTKRSKISGQDVKEAEAGIELLRKMKAVKREDAADTRHLNWKKPRKPRILKPSA